MSTRLRTRWATVHRFEPLYNVISWQVELIWKRQKSPSKWCYFRPVSTLTHIITSCLFVLAGNLPLISLHLSNIPLIRIVISPHLALSLTCMVCSRDIGLWRCFWYHHLPAYLSHSMTPEVRVSRVTRVVDLMAHRCKKYCPSMIWMALKEYQMPPFCSIWRCHDHDRDFNCRYVVRKVAEMCPDMLWLPRSSYDVPPYSMFVSAI